MPAARPSRPALDLARVRSALAGSPWRVEVVDASPSTNADVVRRAHDGEPAGLVVAAEHQTAGRGRLDRVWVTPARAALTFSLLVRPGTVPVQRWPWLPLLTGLAVAEAVRRSAALRATLKWPNDVLVDDAKVAGILVERVEHADGAAAVVGVGVNVSSERDELPVPTATSLTLAGARAVDRSELLVSVLQAFGDRFDAWVRAGGGGLRAPYTELCSTLDRPVRVDLPTGEVLHGTAVGVDEDGRLQVHDGVAVRALGAGDVVHVRGSDGRRPPRCRVT